MAKPTAIDFTAAAVARAKERIRRGETVHTRPGTPLDTALRAEPDMVIVDEQWVRTTLARMPFEAREHVVGIAIFLAQESGDTPSETAMLHYTEVTLRGLDACGMLQRWLTAGE